MFLFGLFGMCMHVNVRDQNLLCNVCSSLTCQSVKLTFATTFLSLTWRSYEWCVINHHTLPNGGGYYHAWYLVEFKVQPQPLRCETWLWLVVWTLVSSVDHVLSLYRSVFASQTDRCNHKLITCVHRHTDTQTTCAPNAECSRPLPRKHSCISTCENKGVT